jgi:O-antigen/teichoic acid export membrane protein
LNVSHDTAGSASQTRRIRPMNPSNGPLAKLKRRGGSVGGRKFLMDNVFATIATVGSGVGGLLVQSLASHHLSPTSFGRAFAVISFYVLLTRPSNAFGRMVAWQTSREDPASTGRRGVSDRLLTRVTILLLAVGGLVFVVSILFGHSIATYLHVSVQFIAIAAIAAPFLLATQPLLGVLQGERNFALWSVLSLLIAMSNLLFVFLLVSHYQAYGVLEGITFGSALTFFTCLFVTRHHFRLREITHRLPRNGYVGFAISGIISTLTVGVFLNAGVVIVEHFFPHAKSGQFASVAVICNTVFYCIGGITSVIFPMVSARLGKSEKTTDVMAIALTITAMVALAGAVTLQFYGTFIVKLFSGAKDFQGVHAYIGLYALGMGVLGAIVILINTQQARRPLALLWILVPAAILRPGLLYLFHGSLLTVVVVSDLTLIIVAMALFGLYIYEERRLHQQWLPTVT